MSTYKEIKEKMFVLERSEHPVFKKARYGMQFYVTFPIQNRGLLLKLLKRAYKRGHLDGEMDALASKK